MPKVFRKENAIYQTEVAKLATAQVQLNANKFEFEVLKVKLDRETRLFNIMLVLGFIGICATIWGALK